MGLKNAVKLTFAGAVVVGILFSCNPPPVPRSFNDLPPPGVVQIWLTTQDQQNLFKRQDNQIFVDKISDDLATIHVNNGQSYQQIDGFGASFVDSSAWLVSQMEPAERDQLMSDLFSPTDGAGISFLRQPMGASDLALPSIAGYPTGEYTYEDIPGQFTISHDEPYIIPLLQEALKLNPNLKIMANPWSPPAWMKTNNSLEQGSLGTTHFQDYADYFVKFITHYQQQKIPIYAITPENEPKVTGKPMPSMYMSAGDQATFIKENLGPALKKADLKTKILAYDHNWDDTDYPASILKDAGNYVAGTAFHCYGGEPEMQDILYKAFPQKEIYDTECSGGTWEGEAWDGGFHTVLDRMVRSLRNWARTYVLWGLVLRPDGSPALNTAGSCHTCRGVVSVTTDATTHASTVIKNPDYYALEHFSKYVSPGALRVSSDNLDGVETVAFRNEDSSNVLVAYNQGAKESKFQVVMNKASFVYTLPAHAVATFRWAGTSSLPAIHGPQPPDTVLNGVETTSFGFPDNDDGNGHYGTAKIGTDGLASDSRGTYEQPTTFAAHISLIDSGALPYGSRIYIPFLKKYFILQDSCRGCLDVPYHFDLWMGAPHAPADLNKLRDCQGAITNPSVQVILNPNAYYPVNPGPLYSDNTSTCNVPPHPSAIKS